VYSFQDDRRVFLAPPRFTIEDLVTGHRSMHLRVIIEILAECAVAVILLCSSIQSIVEILERQRNES
jgi:hypothetical protein